jgi:hypothetical protein
LISKSDEELVEGRDLMETAIEYYEVDIHAYDDILAKANIYYPQGDDEKAVKAGIVYPGHSK